MPVTRTITNLAATITQAALFSAIQTAFTNVGFNAPIDNYTASGDLILVYSVSAGTGTYANTFLRVRITTGLVIAQQIFSAWNTSTKAGTNGSTEVVYTALVTNTNIVFNAFTSSECRLIFVTQGSVMLPLGLIVPVTKRNSWSLNSWTWGLIPTSATMTTWRTTALNPFSNADIDLALITSTRLATANSIDNERDVITNWLFLTQSNQGFVGRTNDDFAVGSFSGSSRYDTINISGTSQQYLVVLPGSGGLALRIA